MNSTQSATPPGEILDEERLVVGRLLTEANAIVEGDLLVHDFDYVDDKEDGICAGRFDNCRACHFENALKTAIAVFSK